MNQDVGQSPRIRTGLPVWLRIGIGLVLIVLLLTQLQWSDRVTTTDGLTSVVVSASESSWEVEDEDGGRRTLSRSEVQAVHPGIASVVANAHWKAGVFALLFALPIPFVNALRWHALLRGLKADAPVGLVTRVTLQHYLVNLVALGTAGGDVYRAAALKSASGGWTRVITGLLLDRFAGVGAMVAFAAVGAALLLSNPDLATLAGISLVVCAASIGLALIAWGVLRSRLLGHWLDGTSDEECENADVDARPTANRLRALLGRIQEAGIRSASAFREIAHDGGSLVRVIGISLLGQALLVMTIWQAADALNIDNAFAAAILVVPAAAIVALFTPTPQGVGAFEWGLVTLLGPFEAGGANRCVVLAVAFRLIMLWWTVPGLILWLSPRPRAGKELTHEPTAVRG